MPRSPCMPGRSSFLRRARIAGRGDGPGTSANTAVASSSTGSTRSSAKSKGELLPLRTTGATSFGFTSPSATSCWQPKPASEAWRSQPGCRPGRSRWATWPPATTSGAWHSTRAGMRPWSPPCRMPSRWQVLTWFRPAMLSAMARTQARKGHSEDALGYLAPMLSALADPPAWALGAGYVKIACDAAETLWLTGTHRSHRGHRGEPA